MKYLDLRFACSLVTYYKILQRWSRIYELVDIHVIKALFILFLCVCVCVFLEYAEALTNPIKHISQLHKRETQLAVLIEDNSEVRHICVFSNKNQLKRQKSCYFAAQSEQFN